ncbi:hypothetical protein N7462_011620 [Penicillium macrosclerotiorum]|uniref:uncharacterized protein n=1 Tax=Penicillium macrosclerotiorum TaxID=303699 RepID=UPI0025477CB4|nr:uncharacterized protein N7462_011620 [Penicillium macrosclerotiorum]KAJ5662694.1 hypothetical protein N7462_011620 [Penicillium macrosclerotiorum]
MADASSEHMPGSDLALSSDEEDFVSSQSTASMEPDVSSKKNLAVALGKLHLDPPSSQSCENSQQSAARTFSERKPLRLLELPLDVLKDIVKEVTHTNDLTSLALTCSSLHALTIPHMYSRFDIVWPEPLNPSSDEYSGVDALSYGLSTLVMGEDVFHQLPLPRSDRSVTACTKCGCDDRGHGPATMQTQEASTGFRSRRGNYYAQYTRTFSIGNGPLGWVQEYSVNREVGKMLGTLVALAVARMVNLEAFIWDMPTGVVRDIWLALASLAERPNHKCRLERIWVRWHDNSENLLRVSAAPSMSSRLLQKYKHVEHPSLSVLPPLKSVAVLDIDEPAYVEELAVLIERSRHRLSELRIGISSKAHLANWLICASETDAPLDSSSNWPRVGGVLSILCKKDTAVSDGSVPNSSTVDLSSNSEILTCPSSAEKLSSTNSTQGDTNSLASADKAPPIPESAKNNTSPDSSPLHVPGIRVHLPYSTPKAMEKLNLEVLELERVPLSVSTVLPAIEWTRLHSITIMRCEDHEHLWRALRRKYAPPALPAQKTQDGGRRMSSLLPEFSLNLKHLRTDTVSPYLILFIKDTLAPNTLESVYLHEAPAYDSTVQVDAIYRHVLRKHRLSLRKLLIDASDRHDPTAENPTTRWHKWMFNHEMISFITGGRMPQLKELGMAMHYRDWHFLLQRLPNMPQLRAIYLPHISHSVHRDLKELALQVLDIVSIRPELKVTYIGLQIKCYQILEVSCEGNDSDFDEVQGTDQTSHGEDGISTFEDDLVDFTDDDHEFSGAPDGSDGLSDDLTDDYDTEPEESGSPRVRFRLQEILFYDDKISIFKARHGVI